MNSSFDKKNYLNRDTSCSCAVSCLVSKTCCPDFQKICPAEYDMSTQYVTLQDTMECIKYIDNDRPVPIVSKCLMFQNTSCSSPEKSIWNEIPVLNKSPHPILFRNIHCAFCNGYNQVDPINYTIHLKGNLENNESPKMNFKSLLRLVEAFDLDYVIQLKFPTNWETCAKNIIETCPKSCKNKELVDKCQENYSLSFVNYDIYKNIYCILCNRAFVPYHKPHLCQPKPSSRFNFYTDTFKYSFLFDDLIKNIPGNDGDDSKKCKSNQILLKDDNVCLNVMTKEEVLKIGNFNICFLEMYVDLKRGCHDLPDDLFSMMLDQDRLKAVEIINYLNYTQTPLQLKDICIPQINPRKRCQASCRKIIKINNSTTCRANDHSMKFLVTPEFGQLFSPKISYSVQLSITFLPPVLLLNHMQDKLCDQYVQFESDSPYVLKADNIVHSKNFSYICQHEISNLTGQVNKGKGKEEMDVIEIFGLVCTTLSLICLFLRIISPVFLHHLRNRGPWLQWNLALAIFAWQFSVFLSSLLSDHEWICRILGVIGHLSILSSVLWQTALAVDIYLRFKEENLVDRPTFTRMKASTIAIVIWSVSSIPIILSVILDILNLGKYGKAQYGSDSSSSNNEIVNDKHCWVHGFSGQFMLLFLPFAFFFLVNIIFLILSIKNLHYLTKKSPVYKRNGSRGELLIYGKLTILFGISWIFMILASFINHDSIFLINIFSNACIGVWLALTTLCSKSMLRNIFKLNSSSSGSNPQSKNSRNIQISSPDQKNCL